MYNAILLCKVIEMITDIRDIDSKLSNKFKKTLTIAILSLFMAIIGTIIAFLVSYNIGYVIALISVITGFICIIICLALRIKGKHLK